MSRRSLAVAAIALALGPIPAASAVSPAVTVTPRVPASTQAITVHFRAPRSTGTFGAVQRVDAVVLSGPRGVRCLRHGDAVAHGARAGTMTTATLDPRRLMGAWCVGRWTGRVLERSRNVCRPAPRAACPLIVAAPRVIARFSFTVDRL